MYPARRGRNVKSLRNKRFHSPYPGRITATRREGRGEVGEKDEIYSLAAVKQRRAWRLRDTLPRIVLSPGKGGVSRRISEASDIRVTIRIAGEFGVDRDKACKRIQVSSRVCVCASPPRFLPAVRSHTRGRRQERAGSSSPLSGTASLRSHPTLKLIQRTRIHVCCTCVKPIRGAAWSGNRLVARLPSAKHRGNTTLHALESKDLRGWCSTRLLIEPFREREEGDESGMRGGVVVEVTPLRALIKIRKKKEGKEREGKVRSG